MNKSFLQFNDAALKSGLLQLNPSLAQQLKSVTETFVTLAKSAAEGNAEGEDEPGEAIEDPTVEPSSAGHTQYQAQPQQMDIGWGYTATVENHSAQQPPVTTSTPSELPKHSPSFAAMPNSPFLKEKDLSVVTFRSPVTVGHVMDQAVSWSNASSNEREDSQQLPFGLIDILSRQHYSPSDNQNHQIFSVNVPTPDVTPPSVRLPTPPRLPSLKTKSIKPTWTYSYDETTFARRLTRAALETGFHLLSSANQRPTALNYVFKLSLPYMNLNDLREKFKVLLSRGTDEDLDCWETPFIHLGGAGTHYPRKDAQGNSVAIPNSWTVRRIGPVSNKIIRAENSSDPSQSHDLNIDLTGFEGEWFDAFDVEGYLEQEKGVHIDPKDSFAEVLIDEDDEQINSSDGDNYLFGNRALKFPYSHPRRSSHESDTPSFTTGSASSGTLSSTSTPANGSASNSMDNLLAPSDSPFGLDMGMNLNSQGFPPDFSKMPETDSSTFFDQPLGLDLAPGFDVGFNANTTLPPLNFPTDSVDMGTLGLDLMGGPTASNQTPLARKKARKAAWVDVSKLVDGELFFE